MAVSSCTTHNPCQAGRLRKALTTDLPGIGILATMRRKLKTGALVQIYAKRQPSKPHYLARLMTRKNVTKGELIETLGVDKSLVSRWLNPDKPSTPSPLWAQKLGKFFAPGPDEEDFVDIFDDPDVRWIARKLEGRTDEEKARIIAIIDAELPAKRKISPNR